MAPMPYSLHVIHDAHIHLHVILNLTHAHTGLLSLPRKEPGTRLMLSWYWNPMVVMQRFSHSGLQGWQHPWLGQDIHQGPILWWLSPESQQCVTVNTHTHTHTQGPVWIAIRSGIGSPLARYCWEVLMTYISDWQHWKGTLTQPSPSIDQTQNCRDEAVMLPSCLLPGRCWSQQMAWKQGNQRWKESWKLQTKEPLRSEALHFNGTVI